MVLRMKWQIFVLAAEIPCEWMFATKFASDCECDGVVHSVFDSFRDFLDTPGPEARGDFFGTFGGFRARRARRPLQICEAACLLEAPKPRKKIKVGEK